MLELQPDTTPANNELMRSAIQRVATGPELSKNLSYEETRAVMHAILADQVDPVHAAVFLIGLRMKRETDDEFLGVLDALRDTTTAVTADTPDVVLIAEPYNGFNRSLQGSLLVLPVLAACGVTACSMGVELVGPKFGVTHHTTLRAMGGDPLLSPQQAAERLANPEIGWAYLDQSRFNPALYALNDLRRRIIKRPVLSTAEVLLAPILGQQRTHLVTGYVHKPYRETYEMLARHMGYDSLLLVRGTEGGITPSFRARAHIISYQGNRPSVEQDIDLEALSLLRSYRAADIPEDLPAASPNPDTPGMKWDIGALAALCADTAWKVLEDEPGPLHDAAVLGAAMVLWQTGRAPDLPAATEAAREAISSGRAQTCFRNGLSPTT